MQPKSSEVDFRGQDIYVGIDVGKRSWKVCIVTEYVEHRVFTQPPTPAMLANYLSDYTTLISSTKKQVYQYLLLYVPL